MYKTYKTSFLAFGGFLGTAVAIPAQMAPALFFPGVALSLGGAIAFSFSQPTYQI